MGGMTINASQIFFNGVDYTVPEDKIAISTAAIHADIPNLNGDLIPWKELEKAAPQYIGCQNVFVDHVTPGDGAYGFHSPNKVESRGEVVDAYCDPEDKCLYLLIFVDKEFPELAEAVLTGALNAVSFGANADIVCGICGKTDCSHIDNRGMGGNFDIMKNIEFSEISIVFDPADPLALFKKVVAC